MIVAWLWQAFRQDLAPIVSGLPYADGRYQAAELLRFPSSDGAGYLEPAYLYTGTAGGTSVQLLVSALAPSALR